MLFEPDCHESLCHEAWDASRAREAVCSIIRDIEQARTDKCQWPVHPLDDEGDVPRTGFKSLYLGSAGVLWALWYLQNCGAAKLTIDPLEGIREVCDAYGADPDLGAVVPSYYLGEVGVLLVRGCLNGWAEVADRMYASVSSNIQNPTNEALWAGPGTMVAAWHLWVATGEQRWRDLFLDNAEHLWRIWVFDEQAQCCLWTQNLNGADVQYLGAAHGFAGNVYPLLKGASLLDAKRRRVLYDRCVATLRATARVEGDAVNWAPGTFAPRPGGSGMLMQWCHGAPGVVTALDDFPPHWSAEMDAMLNGAGNAIWKAGPLTKGYGLCHGTAGNGYAFLKLYRRTGQIVWLERARRFAIHALVQRDRMRQQYGQGRFTLWTGDAGLAVFLWHCLAGEAGLPALDIVQ